MAYGYLVRKCACGKGSVTDSAQREKCKTCNTWYKHTPIEKCTDPDMIIIASEAEMESANYHSMSSLPSALFEKLKSLVPASLHLELAKAIIGQMPS